MRPLSECLVSYLPAAPDSNLLLTQTLGGSREAPGTGFLSPTSDGFLALPVTPFQALLWQASEE